ncbi:TrkA family potassium uptake protein [Candidatus Dependentiae bacterium]|nr:TrkA family potassium uptake protein [Candidatus Dependentiae bacterium]
MKFGVIGLGRFGYQLAEGLVKHGMEVLAIDKDEAIVASIKDKVTQAVCLNVTDEEALKSVGIEEMDTVIVAMGESFEQSVLITAILKKRLHIPYVIARSTNAIHDDILRLVGADKVVLPERYVGKRLAINLSLPFVDLIHITDSFSVTHMKAPKDFIGKTITELNLRKTRHIACIAIKKGPDIVLVEPDYIIMENDELLLAGENKHLAAMVHI